jgi:hypothetical protein
LKCLLFQVRNIRIQLLCVSQIIIGERRAAYGVGINHQQNSIFSPMTSERSRRYDLSMKCDKYTELAGQVETLQVKLVDLTLAQHEAFLERNHAKAAQLDKELELTVGEKERIIGALREHRKEHGCQT